MPGKGNGSGGCGAVAAGEQQGPAQELTALGTRIIHSSLPCSTQSRAHITFGLGDEPGQGVIHAGRPLLIILTRQNDIKDLY